MKAVLRLLTSLVLAASLAVLAAPSAADPREDHRRFLHDILFKKGYQPDGKRVTRWNSNITVWVQSPTESWHDLGIRNLQVFGLLRLLLP